MVQQTPPKFFITHSWKDIDFARRLCDDFRTSGLGGFLDAYSVKPGDIISAEITRGLEACDIYVPILSHAALKSPWCEEEINAAITLGKLPGRNGRPRIIPVLVEDCQDEMPIFLRSRLFINFAGRYDDALTELLTKGFGLKSAVAPTLPVPPVRSVAPPAPASPTLSRTWMIAGGGIMGVLVLCVLTVWIASQFVPAGISAPTRIAQATVTLAPPTSAATSAMQPTASTVPPTRAPTNTPVPPTATAAPKPTEVSKPTEAPKPTTALGIGSTKTSADGVVMVYVPAEKFWMGSSDADKQASDDEKPQHEVDLDAFWIDKFEVTNALYKKCVDAGKCSAPKANNSYTRDPYYGDSKYDNYPVINVTWDNATQYCAFAKKQLPTEAQWEKAARGTDGRIYPWGNPFDANKLNSPEGGKGDTTTVGSYPNGSSPYGVMDMAGNVWEWVADWYDANYYKNSPVRNPKNETPGQFRVLRGGSFGNLADHVRAAARYHYDPDHWYVSVGFRCVE